MNQFTIDKNILLVEVPEDAEPYILESANGKQQGLFYKQPGNSSPPWLVLPPGNWQFIGTMDEVTGNMVSQIIKYVTVKYGSGYKDYEDETKLYASPNSSYASWLKANKIPNDKRLAILKFNP